MRKWINVASVLILVAVMSCLVGVSCSDSDAGKGRITGVITDAKEHEEWHRTFGGENDDLAFSVQQTADGGYIIAGDTNSYDAGGGDAYLAKTDGEGNEEWYRTFGGNKDEYAYSVRQTADGGYIIAGHTYSYGAGERDAYLVKTDGKGNEEWHRTFGGENDDLAFSVQQTADGGYIIAGDTYSYGAGERDAYLVKTDGKGNEEWHRTFGGEVGDTAWSVQQTADGGYIIAGYTDSYGEGGDAYLVKTDEEGNYISIPRSAETAKKEPKEEAMAAAPAAVEWSEHSNHSSTSNINAFAENWWWSKERNQNGRYGETKVNLSLGEGMVTSATLYLTTGYSQQAGTASGTVYISGAQQVQPTDADHDHDNYWYGNSITAGTQAGTFTCSYSGSTSSYDITNFLNNNSEAGTLYIAVENEATADIGVSTIYIKATVIP